MNILRARLLSISALLALAACRQTAPPAAVDPGAAACLTPDTVAVAVADLVRLRASPFVNSLGGSARDFLEQHQSASQALVAWDTRGFLIVERGTFPQAPPGARLLEPGLAVSGSAAGILSALAQHRSGSTGAPGLIEYGSAFGARSALWLAIRGGTALPLSGNLANLNLLLQHADFAGLALDLGAAATLRFSARGHSVPSARQLEERLRGLLSLAGEAEVRRPGLARLIGAARIERSGADVTAVLVAPADAVASLLAGFGH